MHISNFKSHSKTSAFEKLKDLLFKNYVKFIEIEKNSLIRHQVL